jgi:hypothetical protein
LEYERDCHKVRVPKFWEGRKSEDTAAHLGEIPRRPHLVQRALMDAEIKSPSGVQNTPVLLEDGLGLSS